jgi:hypothetical protein
MRTVSSWVVGLVLPAWLTGASAAVPTPPKPVMPPTPPMKPDIPAVFNPPTSEWDYVKREVMIPMRDGVKLHTVIVIPKGAQRAPIILTRTPYNAT